MKKVLLLSALAIFSTATYSAPGGKSSSQGELKALWGGPGVSGADITCQKFVLDTGVVHEVPALSTTVRVDGNVVPLPTATRDDALDMLIRLFIKINGLDATLDDVPLNGSGQRDCREWNNQLIQ